MSALLPQATSLSSGVHLLRLAFFCYRMDWGSLWAHAYFHYSFTGQDARRGTLWQACSYRRCSPVYMLMSLVAIRLLGRHFSFLERGRSDSSLSPLFSMPAYTFAHLNLGLPSVFLALFEAWVGVWATPSLVLYSDPWQILSYQSGSLRRALAQCYKSDLTALIGAVIETGNGVPDAFVSINGLTPAVERAALQAFSQAYAEAYRMVLYSTIPFGIIAVVAALFTKDSTKYMTNHVHVHLVKDVLDRNSSAGQEPGERAEHSPVNPDEKTP